MFFRVNSYWDLHSAGIAGYVPEARYQGFELPALPGADKFWMRAMTTTVTTRQTGHMMPDPPNGSPVVYTNFGFITVQIFAPMIDPTSWSKGELLAELVQSVFMAAETPGNVWFRNPRIREINNDGTWFRWNVISDYQFDQTLNIPLGPIDEFFDDNALSVDGSGDGLEIVGNDLRVDIDSLPSAPIG